MANGSVARCVLVPAWPTHGLVWYVDGQIAGIEEFVDFNQARRRAQELRGEVAGQPD